MKDKTLGELGEVIQNATYSLGHASGLEQAIKDLEDESAKKWRERKDGEARHTKELADLLIRRHQEYLKLMEGSKAKEQQAFAELDRREDASPVKPFPGLDSDK